MPNWCMNNLTISHDDPSMVEKFADAYNSGGVCNTFIPRPEHINNSDAFAADGWYTWNVNNWGTKWDFGKDEYDDPVSIQYRMSKENGIVEISFNTAWSPPIQFYDYLVGLGYKVRASYFEPGCAFCGIYEDGYDDCIDYGGDHNMIPVGIWDEYGCEEFFSE
jgi:hypothetical protein